MSAQLPDYVEVERALGRAEVDVSCAEIHGACCALLAIDQSADQESWLNQVLAGDQQNLLCKEARTLLREIFIVTRQQLNDSGLGFEPLLPEDDDIESRVEAMQAWCQGISMGLVAAGIQDMGVLPDDSREWVEDVVRIGSSGELAMEDEEESENAYAEIIEYLRVGLLMLNEEMQPMKAAPQVH